MSDQPSEESKPIGKLASCFVCLIGLASIVVGAVGNFTHENAATNIAFAIVGIAAVVIAPLLPRLQKFQLSATGASADFSTVEEQIEKGQLVAADKAVEMVEAARTGEEAPSAKIEAPEKPGATTAAGEQSRVFVTANALAALGQLTAINRAAIGRALDNLGISPDPRAIEPGSGGRSYFVHRVGPNLRIFYRQLDKTNPDEHDRYVVMGIQS